MMVVVVLATEYKVNWTGHILNLQGKTRKTEREEKGEKKALFFLIENKLDTNWPLIR